MEKRRVLQKNGIREKMTINETSRTRGGKASVR